MECLDHLLHRDVFGSADEPETSAGTSDALDEPGLAELSEDLLAVLDGKTLELGDLARG